MKTKPEGYPIATLAGGCFWCMESELRNLDGVLYTRVGYTGGGLENPSYKQVGNGGTGHAEAVEVTFDPEKISYQEIIHFFLTKTHNPTQLDRQGMDVGPQYRSVIFYHDEKQKGIAEYEIRKIDALSMYKDKIVTAVIPAQTFWQAEEYHQQYYEKYKDTFGQIHPRAYLKQKAKMIKGIR